MSGGARRWAVPILILGALALAACARGPHSRLGPAPRLADAKTRIRQPPPPAEWFWDPIDADMGPSPSKPLDLPIAESDLRRVEGSARIWDDLPPAAQERLLRDGVLVMGSLGDTTRRGAAPDRARASIGAFYTHARQQRLPHLVTLDALFSIVHLGIVHALARVEDTELAPALQTFLERLDARLNAEAAGASTELVDAYRTARDVIAVAHALASTSAPPLPPELAGERARIEGAAGVAASPLLGVRVDYARFAVPATAARPGAFRALAWLGAAPLTLVARTETAGGQIGVAQARTNARAAMLLARLCDRDVDAAVNASYTRILRLLSFVWGPPDDLSLIELDALAESVGIDVTKPENIVNVARVDKVRTRALAGRAPALHDGSGGAARGGINVRVFGGHAPADSIVLQSLVGSPVGLAQETAAAASIDRLRKGRRVLPSTLDVAAWLGAPESRALLHETGADAFDDYERTLASLQSVRSTLEQGALHASVHGSLVDALIAWANAPRAGTASTPAADRMRVESILSAWTLARHTGQALARARPRPAAPPAELHVSGAPLVVLVEPMPDVIARLLGTVRQLRHGLGALAPAAAGPAPALLEIEDILQTALAAAQRQSNDEPRELRLPEEEAVLASLPARIAKLEEEAPEEVGPVTAGIHADPASHRLLVSATGPIEPALVIVRDPTSNDAILTVGAHLAHHELVTSSKPEAHEHAHAPLTDASWRLRLEKATQKPDRDLASTRATWVSAFRWTR